MDVRAASLSLLAAVYIFIHSTGVRECGRENGDQVAIPKACGLEASIQVLGKLVKPGKLAKPDRCSSSGSSKGEAKTSGVRA